VPAAAAVARTRAAAGTDAFVPQAAILAAPGGACIGGPVSSGGAYDVAIVGGGIVGLATARALARPGVRLVVLEAEERLAAHQSGHNSGVIHSGLYYRPGSLKARDCVEGREAMYRFCAEHGIPHERCGKLVVATEARELPGLDELERRGRANGLAGLRRLGPEEIRAYEPNVRGVAALLVPDTGIVDFAQVTAALGESVRAGGGEIRLRTRVIGVAREAGGLVLRTTQGDLRARHLINCGGLQSDRIARLCGLRPGVAIVPFRGEYYQLRAERRHVIRNLVYPVPDATFPFLGVHFTRRIDGSIEAGPNAVLAFRREGYGRWSLSARDVLALAAYGGFWRMAGRYWRTGVAELGRSLSKRAFVAALRRLVPGLAAEDLVPGGTGVRAQAVEPNGALVDDFRIAEVERMIHVLNAPSPAATASLAIGKAIAGMAGRRFDLPRA
jgi:L-2-hydroxyglutarate oxidase